MKTIFYKLFSVTLFLFLCVTNVRAYDFEVGGICYNIIDTETVGVAESNNYSGDIVIPSTVDYNGTTFSVTSINRDAFYCCTDLTSIELPNSIITIGYRAFIGCTNLTSINIPNSVTTIEELAFNGCTGLTNIKISNSLKTIGKSAFSGCTALISLKMPNSVTTIGSGAFYNCAGLKSIYCMKEVPASIRSNNFSDEQYETITLYVPTGSLEKYKTADIWKNFKNFVEFDATNIDDIVEGELNGYENIYYDLNGRIVENPTHGIYIVNGKKVFVK